MTETQEFVVPKSIPITSFPKGLELDCIGQSARDKKIKAYSCKILNI